MVVGCGLVLVFLWTACEKAAPPKKQRDSIEHKASIPIIPRGRVVVATAKGERYLLEIEARMSLTQAVSFYRRQLARENWSELRVQKVQPGLWGLTARRGMFEITGRIKQLNQGVISIGFERKVRKREAAVIPPVPKDVPILRDQIIWRGPYFEAPDGRAEIRGSSALAAPALGKTLLAALQLKGWTVQRHAGNQRFEATKRITRTLTPETCKAKARQLQQRGWQVKLLKDGKTFDAVRRLVYHVESAAKGAQVRMILAYSELTPARAKDPGQPRPAAGPDAGAARPRTPQSANVVPLPKDLTLWPSTEPVLGVRRSETVLSFTLDRKCKSPTALLEEIRKLLGKRGYHGLNAGRPAGQVLATRGSRSATLFKGKRAVVVIVNRELEACTVQLTLVRKGR